MARTRGCALRAAPGACRGGLEAARRGGDVEGTGMVGDDVAGDGLAQGSRPSMGFGRSPGSALMGEDSFDLDRIAELVQEQIGQGSCREAAVA